MRTLWGPQGSDVLERLYTAGGGVPPPPPFPMFEADSQNCALVPRGFKLKIFWPPSAGTIGGPWQEGGSEPTPPLPLLRHPLPPLLLHPCRRGGRARVVNSQPSRQSRSSGTGVAVVCDVPPRTIAVRVSGLSTGVSLCLNSATERCPWSTRPLTSLSLCCVSVPAAPCPHLQYLGVASGGRSQGGDRLCVPRTPARPRPMCVCTATGRLPATGPGPWQCSPPPNAAPRPSGGAVLRW